MNFRISVHTMKHAKKMVVLAAPVAGRRSIALRKIPVSAECRRIVCQENTAPRYRAQLRVNQMIAVTNDPDKWTAIRRLESTGTGHGIYTEAVVILDKEGYMVRLLVI